jgi:hypothetical protein
LQEEDLDTVSGGRNLHFGKSHFGEPRRGKLHFGNLHFGETIVQTNIAVEIGVAIGGNVIQLIEQSNVV